MKKDLAFFYWIFIGLLQIYLLRQKIEIDEFYLWNAVALISSAVFLFYRIKKQKVLVTAEMTIALFIAVNAIVSVIGQFISFYDSIILVVGILVAILSFAVTFTVWKIKKV
jgi:hypothetical protein